MASKVERIKDLAYGSGALVALVSVPIGNDGDISERAKEILAKADIVCCEDTRTTGALLSRLGIRAHKLVSLYSQIEGVKAKEIIAGIKGTDTLLAYCSDAGTPGISDPGALLAKEAIDAGIRVTAIPGASAVLSALVISGLDTADFVFYGFLSTKEEAREKQLEEMASQKVTMVFYEAPSRVLDTLKDMYKAFADRHFALLTELTKEHEEAIRGTLGEYGYLAPESIKGECVIVVEGFKGDKDKDQKEVTKLYALYKANGISPSLAAKLISKQLNLKKNEVYGFIKDIEKD